MSTYSVNTPADIKVRPDVEAFIKEFYRVSDTPGQHDAYVDQFTKDATFILASKTVKGSADIRTAREGMWAAVESRKHTLHKVFPFGNDATEFMLYGTVDLTLRSGGNASLEWAARGVVDFSGGKGRFSFYQVFLDTGAANAYKK